MTSIPTIASKLTKAGVEIMRRPLGLPSHPFYPGAAHRACRALVAEGLLEETADNIGNPTFRFTPLGLSVRTHLEKEAGK